jgi:tripartite-type tricarboxylate transporter receptor subunit TctC
MLKMARQISVTRRRVVLTGAMALAATVSANRAASGFPNKTVRIFLPFSAGTTVDVMARALSQALEPILGDLPVVVNRAGAAGLIALTEILAAEPDGHTWLLSGAGQFTIQPHLRKQSQIRPGDFIPVCQLYETPLTLVAGVTSNVSSFEDLLARARAEPKTITVANYGPGSATHLMMAAIAMQSGVEFLGVSYRNQAQLTQDLVSGIVQVAILAPGAYSPDVVRHLLILASERLASLPEIRTIAEAGQPLPFVSFAGIHLPSATDPSIVAQVEGVCKKAAATDIFQGAGKRAQVVIDVQPSSVFAERISKQSQEMKQLIGALQLTIE